MGDIDRSSPHNDHYDHSSQTATPRPGNPPGLVQRLGSLIGIGNGAQKEPVSAAPGYEGKTPQQIADEMSK